MSDLLDAALAYAAQGIPIFPCVPGTKRPLTPRGFHDATTDPETIRDWWGIEPEANIAFSPHTVGQGVVDLDPPDGEEAWIAFAGGLEPTWTVRTPRCGLHLYNAGELPTSVRKVVPGAGIDTRGKGSYALLPPSRTPDGAYVLVDERLEAEAAYFKRKADEFKKLAQAFSKAQDKSGTSATVNNWSSLEPRNLRSGFHPTMVLTGGPNTSIRP